jgi:tetratricopeptide (TPR) repeat protein
LQTQASAQLSTADTLRGDETVINNLHRVAQAAASFHSNASSIMGARSTVWGGSVIGEPLSQEAFINIQNWIPPPVDEADRFGDSSSGPKSPSADSFSNMKSIPSYDPAILPVTETLNLDYESDIDQDLAKDFERLATASLQRNDYRKAEVFLGKILSRVAARDEEASLRLNLQIAYLRGMQGKFLDMIFSLESLLESQPNTLEKAHTYHTLALAYLQDTDLEKSAIACKAAIRCKRRLIGKVASSSYESVALLAHIWDVCEDPEEAEGCRSLLPPGYIYTGILEPVKYMSENLDCLKSLVESSKKPLTFAISMGVTYTVVAWCYGQELGEAAEVNLWTHWPNPRPVKWSDAKVQETYLHLTSDTRLNLIQSRYRVFFTIVQTRMLLVGDQTLLRLFNQRVIQSQECTNANGTSFASRAPRTLGSTLTFHLYLQGKP